MLGPAGSPELAWVVALFALERPRAARGSDRSTTRASSTDGLSAQPPSLGSDRALEPPSGRGGDPQAVMAPAEVVGTAHQIHPTGPDPCAADDCPAATHQ